MDNQKVDRNAEIFDYWWSGVTEVSLGNVYGISQQAVHNIILRQIKDRKLALHTITKKFRNDFGSKTPPPENMAELRQLVIEQYGLEDR